MFLNGDSVDCCLVATDGDAIDAHCTVLIQASPFLSPLLQHKLSGSPVIVLTKSFISIDILKLVLELMYTGKVNFEAHQYADMVSVAKYFELKTIPHLPHYSLLELPSDPDSPPSPLPDSRLIKMLRESEFNIARANWKPRALRFSPSIKLQASCEDLEEIAVADISISVGKSATHVIEKMTVDAKKRKRTKKQRELIPNLACRFNLRSLYQTA